MINKIKVAESVLTRTAEALLYLKLRDAEGEEGYAPVKAEYTTLSFPRLTWLLMTGYSTTDYDLEFADYSLFENSEKAVDSLIVFKKGRTYYIGGFIGFKFHAIRIKIKLFASPTDLELFARFN